MPDFQLDITGEVCPMTFVRAKLALEKVPVGQILNIRLRAGEPLHNVPRAMRDHGHEIVRLAPVSGESDLYDLVVRRVR